VPKDFLLRRFRHAHIAGVSERVDAGTSVGNPSRSNCGDITQGRRRFEVPSKIRGQEKQVNTEAQAMGQPPRHHVTHIDWRHALACCNRSAVRVRTKSGAIAALRSRDDAKIAIHAAPDRGKNCNPLSGRS
jgi:hypothetical protein